MGGWYWIGVLAGLGAAIGVLGSGLLPRRVTALAAAVIAAAIGIAVFGWAEAVGGLAGGASGGARRRYRSSRGALRRGGTRGGLAALVGLGALRWRGARVRAGARLPRGARRCPCSGLRLRSREPERYAGPAHTRA